MHNGFEKYLTPPRYWLRPQILIYSLITFKVTFYIYIYIYKMNNNSNQI